MEPRDVFFFDRMLTPQVITIIYWIFVAVILVGGIGAMFTQSFLAGLLGMLVALVFARIWCELLIVVFKMNDALQAIRNQGNAGTAGESPQG